jgi:predicted permease
MVDGLVQDIRFGIRMLTKSPGFTAVAALSLALGIGANTTIFTLINAVRLKMLPVGDPAELVILRWSAPDGIPTPARSTWGSSRSEGGRQSGTSFSYPAFLALREQNQVFSSMFGFVNLGRVSLTASGEPGLAQAQLVTGGAFETLGLSLALGRGISDEDDKVGAEPVGVISHGYWQRRFGGDSAIVGRSVAVNGKPVSIVGVTPARFTGLNPGNADDLWMPLQSIRVISPDRTRGGENFARNDFWWVPLMGRLKPGMEAAAAQANVETVFKQMAMEGITVTGTPPVIPSVELTPGGQGIDQIRRELDKPLTIMMVVVFLVALIACANVANLLLARAAVRRKEIAVRLSLGTNRARLIRQLLTESALLAGLGSALGFALAWAGSRFMVGMMGRGDRPMTLDLTPDLTILAFTAAAGILTTLVFGLAPALRATSIEPFATLRESTGGAGGGRTIGLARGLVVGQVALSLVLLAGASLFVRTLHNLRNVDVGFEESGLLLFGVNGRQAGFTGAELADLYERIQGQLEALPGVTSATMTPFPLLASSASSYSFSVPGYVPKPDERMNARVLHVGSRFFETMGLPLALGRGLEPRDRDGAPLVAVANQALVKKYMEGTTGLGRSLSFGRNGENPVEIVGIASNAKYDRLRGDILPTLYIPMRQSLDTLNAAFFEVRTTLEPLSMVPDARKAVAAVNPGLPLYEIKSQAQQIDQLLLPERMFATLTSFFGLLALALVCVGLYGIVSYGVAMRTTEIGVRMALGARSFDIVGMVLKETASLVAKGVALGLPVAFASGHFAASVVAGLLFGLEPTDAFSLGAATLVMILIGSLAGFLPARRASCVAPIAALRCE